MFQFDQVVIDMIWKGIRETLFMTLMSTLMGYVLGLPPSQPGCVPDFRCDHQCDPKHSVFDPFDPGDSGNPVYRRPKLWIGSNGGSAGDRSGTIYCPQDRVLSERSGQRCD